MPVSVTIDSINSITLRLQSMTYDHTVNKRCNIMYLAYILHIEAEQIVGISCQSQSQSLNFFSQI